MDLYFLGSSSSDGSDPNNWWNTPDFSGGNNYTPSISDDCYIVGGVTCSSDNFSRNFLYVQGTLDMNNGTVTSVTSGGLLVNNLGAVQYNEGTVSFNYGTVSGGSGSVTNQVDTFYFVETVSTDPSILSNWFVDAGLSVTASILPVASKPAEIHTGNCANDSFAYSQLTVADTAVLTLSDNGIYRVYGTVTVSNGTIDLVAFGAVVDENTGTVTTNSGTVAINNGTITNNSGACSSNTSVITYNTGTIAANYGTVANNDAGGVVTTNYATITTNSVGGTVTNNLYGAVITTNSGTVRIGTISGGAGTIAASATTNLANHTAGTNVTLPSGGSLSWW